MAAIREIMTEDVVGIEAGETLRSALELFRSEGVSGAPVLQGGRVVGVVSLTDLSEFAATTSAVPSERPAETEGRAFEAADTWKEGTDSPSAYFVDFWSNVGAELTTRFEGSESPEWDLLEEHVVSEVMTPQVVHLPPDAEIREAARLMVDAEVQRILVLEGEELRGIVTATDVVRAVAERKV